MYNYSSEDSNLSFFDLEIFWDAYNSSYPKFNPKTMQELYFNKASCKAKTMYIPFFIQNINNLTEVIKANVHYFNSLKNTKDIILKKECEIKNAFCKLLSIYPEAIMPEILFVVGIFRSAGAFMNGNLFISVEMFSEKPQIINNVETLSYAGIIDVIMHEIIHFQQHNYHDNSLLATCINEGSADFITELILGRHPSQNTHNIATKDQKKLWNKFKDFMFKKNYHNWLYTSDNNISNDLGYWIGYKIVKSFYNKRKDKTKAIKDILNIQNYHAFLLESGHEG